MCSIPRGHCQQMRARALDGRLFLDAREKLEQLVPLLLVVPDLLEVDGAPRRSLDGEDANGGETCFSNLRGQILRAMEIRGHEIDGIIGRIAMLAGS